MSVVTARDLLVEKALLRVPADFLQSGHSVDDIHGQAEAIDVVIDRQLQRRVDIAFFLVAANMHVVVIVATVRQTMNQPGLLVDVEDDRLVHREQGVEITIGKPVWVLRLGLKFEQVDHVDEPELDVREFLS